MESILKTFNLKDTLNSNIWLNTETNDFSQIKIDKDIRYHLLAIAQEFILFLKIGNIEIEDVIVVGSITNYNWSEYSDIDLHIVVDKKLISEDSDVVDELLSAKKNIFNSTRNITIRGFSVELYVQDISETLKSDGVFSVVFNKWINTPVRKEFKLDKENIIKKVKEILKMFSEIRGTGDEKSKIKRLNQLKDKIKKYRKSGLDNGGEYSVENLVFKYLRRSGFIEELLKTKINAQDKILSVENIEF